MTTAEKPTTASGPPLVAPRRRRLRTFAFDPMSTRLSGQFLTVSVPFEDGLRPGPDGELVQVVDFDPARDHWYAPVDLNDPFVLAQDGLRPNENDPRTHQQIVYAVTMSVIERFERYLGRRFRWRGQDRLRLVPHAFEGRNAFFDPKRRAVLFGYYHAVATDPGANLPGQMIFTCLSSDIIAHEVTHALLHRLRRRFNQATNPDVFAWHEAFADLITLFQHFAHRDVVVEAVTTTRGDLQKGGALFDLAREFGQSSGRGAALRSAIDPNVATEKQRTPDRFRAAREAHERGSCFVAAVFDAYVDHFSASVADLLRIATSGTGVLPQGHLHPDLVGRVATSAITTADAFLGMVVRAIDYLPPVDVTFGDVVRAIVTADRSLYPDDVNGYRRELVEALRRRGIYPESVSALTDNALVWPPPPTGLTLTDGEPRVPLEALILDATMKLDVAGEFVEVTQMMSGVAPPPTTPTIGTNGAPKDSPSELYAPLVEWAKKHAYELGLQPADKTCPISMEGVHVAFRQADDRQPRPEFVIQFTQRRKDLEEEQQPDVADEDRIQLRAGTTVIARINGRVDYVITKPLAFKVPYPEEFKPFHDAGVERYQLVTKYFKELDSDDPLSVWRDDEPAVNRLDFASLHDGMESVM
jgi:hypothetical protein